MLDIVPTGDTLRRADWRFGMGYWHWFFLAQAHPLPERMISADPIAFLFRHGQGSSDFEAYEDFLQNARDPAAIHAMCEDYRAAVSVDFQQDQADRGTRKIECPTLVMWGNRGVIPKWYDPVGIWKEWASDVRGEEIESGHMLAEEAPDATYQALRALLRLNHSVPRVLPRVDGSTRGAARRRSAGSSPFARRLPGGFRGLHVLGLRAAIAAPREPRPSPRHCSSRYSSVRLR